MSILERVVWKEERKVIPFYSFTEGDHVVKIEEIIDKEEPRKEEVQGRERHAVRLRISDEEGNEYFWDVDVPWDEQKKVITLSEKSESVIAQLVKLQKSLGGIEGKTFKVTVLGKGREKRYTIAPMPAVAAPVAPEVAKLSASEVRDKLRKLMEEVKVPREKAVKILSDMYKVSAGEIERIVSEKPEAKPEVDLHAVAKDLHELLLKKGESTVQKIQRFVAYSWGNEVDASKVIEELKKFEDVKVEGEKVLIVKPAPKLPKEYVAEAKSLIEFFEEVDLGTFKKRLSPKVKDVDKVIEQLRDAGVIEIKEGIVLKGKALR